MADEDRALKVLQNLEKVASVNPDMLVPISSKLVKVITEIFLTRDLPLRVRNSAMYLCGSFTQGLAKKLKKSEFFDTCVPRLFELLIIEAPAMGSFENLSSTSQAKTGQGIGNQFEITVQSAAIYDNILETLAKICEALNIKQTLAKIMPMIMAALNPSPDAVDANGNKLDVNGGVQITDFVNKSRWAGMEVLGSVLDGSKRYYHKDLPNLINLVMPFLDNKCPMVLYSTLTTLGVMSEEYYPLIQKQFGAVLLRKLGTIMLDEKLHIKLRGRAIGCLVNLTRELLTNCYEDNEDEEARVEMQVPLTVHEKHVSLKEIEQIFQGQFETVAQGVVSLFTLAGNTSNFVLLENALVAVSILSNIMSKEFIKCYDFFSDGLKSLLGALSAPNAELTEQQINLQILVVDTFSFLLSGCKSDSQKSARVSQDFEMILEFIRRLATTIPPKDPRNKTVLSFWSIVIRNYPEQFQQNRDIIMNSVFRGMGLHVEISMQDTERFQGKSPGVQAVAVDLRAFGGKKILSMDHGSMELKLTAFEVCVVLLKKYSKTLADTAKAQILSLVKNALTTLTSSLVKTACFKLIKLLVKSCPASDQKVQLLEGLLPELTNEIQKFRKLYKHKQVFQFGRKLISILRSVSKNFYLHLSWERTGQLMSTVGLSALAGQIGTQMNALFHNDVKRPRKPQNFEQIVQLMGVLMDYQTDLKQAVRKEFELDMDTMDQEALEEFEDAFAEGNEILQLVMELYGELLKFDLTPVDQQNLFSVFEKSFLSLNADLQQRVSTSSSQALTCYVNPDEMTYISCFYCDSIELLDASLLPVLLPRVDLVNQVLFSSCASAPDVLQNVAFMNNLLASRFALLAAQGQGSEFVSNLLPRLQFLSQLKDLLTTLNMANPDMYGPAMENSLSTVIRFVLLFRANMFPDASALHSALSDPLAKLPLKEDPVEGVVIHSLVCGVLKCCPNTIHQNTQQMIQTMMPKILALEFAESMQDKEVFEEKKVTDDMVCAIIRKNLVALLGAQ